MDCVDWGGLMRIQGVIFFILIWSLYYNLNSKRNTKMAITILDVNDPFSVTRQDAKSNLHFIREKNARCKIDTALFDRIEYEQRAKNFIKIKKDRMNAAQKSLFINSHSYDN